MLRKLLPAILLAAFAQVTAADTLLIEGVEAAMATRLDRPASGSTMATVRERFGEPAQTMPAVGEPPITRWEYPGFVVYFENDRVIHTVVRR